MAVPYARRFALKHGFVDQPGGRKTHEGAIPPIGGLVIFSVFILVSLISGKDFIANWPLYLGLFLLLGTGYVDDRYYVPASLKFFIHFTAAFLAVVPGDVQLTSLGNMFGAGDLELGWFAPYFSVACIVYLINALNMMDGLDGLAAGKSLVILLWLMMASGFGGQIYALLPMLILSAALLGFLFYNMRHPWRRKACVFMGDAGSMSLGFSLACFCIGLSQGEQAVLEPISIAWILALPIIDAFGLFAMRIKEGRHPFSADRRHFHHHFLNAGFSDGKAVSIILSIGAVFGGIGYFMPLLGVPLYVLTWSWIVLWLCYASLAMKPDGFIRFLAKIHKQ